MTPSSSKEEPLTRLTLLTIRLASFAAACTDDPGTTDPGDSLPPEGNTAGSQDQTFDHDNNGFDPWAVIDRLAKEGPARYTSRVHGCAKIRYQTFGNVLTSLGVNLADVAAL